MAPTIDHHETRFGAYLPEHHHQTLALLAAFYDAPDRCPVIPVAGIYDVAGNDLSRQ